MIVAIDGPSGTGKSSTSKAVAARLGLRYLDTGAQYRAMTWWMLSNGIDVNDPGEIAAAAGKPVIVSGTDPQAPAISADGADASAPIRSEEVTAAVSAVSAVPEVRALITELQRTIAAGTDLPEGAVAGIVVEGRDIGTTVLPDADLKVFLTASPEARRPPQRGAEGHRRQGHRRPGHHPAGADRARQGRLQPEDLAPEEGRRRRRGGHHRADPGAGHRVRGHPRREGGGGQGRADGEGCQVTDSDSVPGERGATVGRRIGIGLMYGMWKPRVLGAWRMPPSGPVILAVNHSHNIDGPMLMGTAPRPVHFLIKQEAFIGPLDPFLRGIGQLKVDRSSADRTAIGNALGVLERGGVLGIFPEGTRGEGDFASLRSGLAYFALRSGAPVVPVAVLGSAGAPAG